jgi:23S rRNA (pseudouridine1915-N3)-methyltransferase
VRLGVIAVGRLKSGPERDLAERYAGRIVSLGRQLGFSGFAETELAESRARDAAGRRAEEGGAILSRLDGWASFVLDERAPSLTSAAFAEQIRHWRDEGRAGAACIIGGPDGLDASVRAGAGRLASFGQLTLPHQLVRVLVLEQLYRALTIIAGHPYHRDGEVR